MESLNVLKGYDKVNVDQPPLSTSTATLNHHHRKTTQKSFLITLALVALLALTLLVAVLITVLIHKSNVDPPKKPSSLPSNSADSLRIVCNVTQYPETCFASISSLNVDSKSDPETIFKLSLLVAIGDIKNMTLFLRSVNDANSQAAIDACLSQFDDGLSQLSDSVSAMEKVLTLEKVNDIQTWVSAVMTDEDTCIEGLEELGSQVIDEVKNKMERSKQSLSNSLAIIANMQTLLQIFGLKMH